MSYFKDDQNIQTSLYAGGGATTLTLSNFFVPGGATLDITSLRNHFHANYAANTFLSNTAGFYPPGADASLLYAPSVIIPAFTNTLSANQLIDSNSVGLYVVVIGGGGGGGGGRNNTAVAATTPLTRTVQNPVHPYVNNYTFDFTLTATNAVSMSIVFNASTATEAGYDFLRFYSDAATRNASVRTSATGSIYSNSGSSWPTTVLNFGTVYGRFMTDTSVTAYGFNLTATFSGTPDNNGNGGASGGSGAVVGYYFDFAANGVNPNGAYYKYITGGVGGGGGVGSNTTGGIGGAGIASQFQFFNSSNTQIFSIVAGGGSGGGGGTTGTATGGAGGTTTLTGTALGLVTGTIQLNRTGTAGLANSTDTPGAAVLPVFSLQNSAAGAYSVIGTYGQGGSGGYGDGTVAPNASAGSAGLYGPIQLFKLFGNT